MIPITVHAGVVVVIKWIHDPVFLISGLTPFSRSSSRKDLASYPWSAARLRRSPASPAAAVHVDVETLYITDIHSTTSKKHDAKIGPQVA